MEPYGPRRPWWRKPLARDVHWLWTPVAVVASVGFLLLQVWSTFFRPFFG